MTTCRRLFQAWLPSIFALPNCRHIKGFATWWVICATSPPSLPHNLVCIAQPEKIRRQFAFGWFMGDCAIYSHDIWWFPINNILFIQSSLCNIYMCIIFVKMANLHLIDHYWYLVQLGWVVCFTDLHIQKRVNFAMKSWRTWEIGEDVLNDKGRERGCISLFCVYYPFFSWKGGQQTKQIDLIQNLTVPLLTLSSS